MIPQPLQRRQSCGKTSVRLAQRRVGQGGNPSQLHLARLHADCLNTKDSRRQPGPEETVDLAHPPGTHGLSRGSHGAGDLFAFGRLELRHRGGPACRRWLYRDMSFVD
ncbi:hypothetical protein VTK26DRAFT_1642 [Humicola hyalothermophila]